MVRPPLTRNALPGHAQSAKDAPRLFKRRRAIAAFRPESLGRISAEWAFPDGSPLHWENGFRLVVKASREHEASRKPVGG